VSDRDGTERAMWCYGLLLNLYPKRHRAAFGAQMLRTFQDHYNDVRAHGGRVGVAFWLAVVGDEAKNSMKEHIVDLRVRHLLPNLLWIGAALLAASSFLWMPGYILFVKIPAVLLVIISFAVKRSLRRTAAAQNAAEHVWTRQGLWYGGLLGLLWIALNLARYLSASGSSLRTVAKTLDVGILLLAMPILFGLAGLISGRSSGTVKDGTLAGLLAAIIGAAIMALSLVAIMALFWDTVRGNAFQSAEMIRAWHASGTQSFSRYLWGDNLGGVLAMTIVSLIFGGLLGTLGGALGAALRGKMKGTRRSVTAWGEGIGG
jgi:hypothetical protein